MIRESIIIEPEKSLFFFSNDDVYTIEHFRVNIHFRNKKNSEKQGIYIIEVYVLF